jgi:hypothetical protein
MTSVLACVGQFILLHLTQTSARIFVKAWFKPTIKRLLLVHSIIVSSCPLAKEKLELWIFVNIFYWVRHDRTIIKQKIIYFITSFTYNPTYFGLLTTFKNQRHFREVFKVFACWEIRNRQLELFKIM